MMHFWLESNSNIGCGLVDMLLKTCWKQEEKSSNIHSIMLHRCASHNWRWEWEQVQLLITFLYIFYIPSIDTEASSEIFKCLLRSLQVSITFSTAFWIHFKVVCRFPTAARRWYKKVKLEITTKREMCSEMKCNDNKNRYQTTETGVAMMQQQMCCVRQPSM